LDAIIDFSGVEKFLDTPVKHYSSGMYMRLAFAVAAHLDSEILIVDEVLSVGDAEFQRKCLGKMGEITKKEGRTILFVSHNLEAVRRLCNGCILLNKGNKVFAGGVEKTIAEYISLQSKVDLKASSRGNNINHKGSGTLSFTDIEIWDANNKRRNTFNTGETVKLKISYAIYKNMEGLHLIISLFSSKVSGLLLTDMRHEIKSGAAIKGERGDVVVEVKLEGLRPGEYLLDFWLGDKAAVEQNNLVNYDVVENMTKPLIIETRNESERKLTGAFSLPSKVISK
jgi:lipopolysaccharide transport system ATP-binding protein